jgi:hypothetical protein
MSEQFSLENPHQPAHEPRWRHVEAVIVDGGACDTIRTVSIRPSAMKEQWFRRVNRLHCSKGSPTLLAC